MGYCPHNVTPRESTYKKILEAQSVYIHREWQFLNCQLSGLMYNVLVRYGCWIGEAKYRLAIGLVWCLTMYAHKVLARLDLV